LWGRRDISIPASAVTKVENGIWLNLTKEQVEDLPPAVAGQDRRRHPRAASALHDPQEPVRAVAPSLDRRDPALPAPTVRA
jgi:hypothetical protein